MLLTLIRSQSPLAVLPLILVGFLCFMLAVSIHESAHAYAAYKLGDPTARSLGRISLDPRKHIDPIGFVLWLLIGFGWAKPVPVSSRYFKKPKRDLNIVSLAGPMSNFIFAFAIIVLEGLVWLIFKVDIIEPLIAVTAKGFINVIIQLARYALYYLVVINVVLGVFNLLPIPPLDGSKLLLSVLPNKIAYKVYQYERYIQIVFYVLVISGGTGGIVFSLSDALLRSMNWIVFSIVRLFS